MSKTGYTSSVAVGDKEEQRLASLGSRIIEIQRELTDCAASLLELHQARAVHLSLVEPPEPR